MINDPRVAFKIAFLLRCAEEGLNEAETAARIKTACEKRADPWSLVTTPLRLVGNAAVGAIKTAPMLAAGGALALGGAGGLALAKMKEKGLDTDAVRRHELISAYNTLADSLEHEQRTRRRNKGELIVPVR